MGDIINGSNVCRQMNGMCHSFTVGEILSIHSMDNVSRDHKMELGKFIIGFVGQRYASIALHRRFVKTESGESFWARLYHPSSMPDILLAMTCYFNRHGITFDATSVDDFDWDANSDEDTPILLSATYGDHDTGRTTDVTVIMRYLLMRKGNKRLKLRPPPRGPRYWYNYLFGDPCPNVTKSLQIMVRYSRSGETETWFMVEDRRFDVKLRALKPESS